jgi:DNA-binding LacI/PurR family transcriptional regulator
MLDVIDKNCKTALSTQVSEKLIHDIRLGNIKPGKRMPGERRLAERFGISRGTVIEALDFLETQNYIERIPAKGTFVADDVNHELSVIKIAFPFPEASISPSSLGHMENWGMVSEAYSGMIAEASKQNAEISFMHFEEAVTEIQLTRQMRRLESYDCAIFIGYLLSNLRHKFIQNGKLCASIAGTHPDMKADAVVANDSKYAFEQLAVLAKSKKYKKLRVISESNINKIDREGLQIKLEILRKAFEQEKIETKLEWEYEINSSYQQSFANLFADKNFNLKNGTELIYCSNTNLVPLLYRYCFDNNIMLGKDIGAFGYATGITFTNLMPSFTYGKINHFEMGRQACAECIDAVRSGKKIENIKFVKNILVKGETI